MLVKTYFSMYLQIEPYKAAKKINLAENVNSIIEIIYALKQC